MVFGSIADITGGVPLFGKRRPEQTQRGAGPTFSLIDVDEERRWLLDRDSYVEALRYLVAIEALQRELARVRRAVVELDEAHVEFAMNCGAETWVTNSADRLVRARAALRLPTGDQSGMASDVRPRV